MNDVKSCLLVGVGGQGAILISKIMSNGFMKAGYDVKQSEVHGMAQRGGSVSTQVRWGKKVYGPVFGKGEADIMVALEKMEAVRYAEFLKPGGVAVIKVGAATETEMKEKKLRIEDALNATRAAVEEGIVAGGGTAYVNAVPAVEKLIGKVEGDEKTGVQIVAKALEEPIRQIAANAGLDGSVILEKVRNSGKLGYGFDAYKEEYCDMVAAGIIDPAKVTRSALENAASVAEMVLTTESLVADLPEPPAAPAAGGDMGGMGGMY